MSSASSASLPKPCQALVDSLASGKPITAETLKQADTKKRAAAFGALRVSVLAQKPDKEAEYRALQSDVERRQFLADYLLDPSSCTLTGTNSCTRSTKRLTRGTTVWLTVSQLAGAQYLNSKTDAEIAIKSLRSRPHKDNQSMREAGIKEYEYTHEAKHTDKAILDEAKVEAVTTNLSEDQYATVRAHMTDEGNPGATPANAAVPPQRKGNGKRRKLATATFADTTEVDPEKQAHEEANARATKAMQGLKIAYDQVHKDLSAVSLVESRLKAKKWNTDSPLQFLQQETKKVSEVNDSIFAQWISAKDIDLQALSKAELVTHAEHWESESKRVKDTFRAYSRDVLSEFSKMR